MNDYDKITAVYENALRLPFDSTKKIVLMSDVHRGDGSFSDNLLQNHNMYYGALQYYFNEGYTYIELGDGDELWANKKYSDIAEAHRNSLELVREFYRDGRFHMLFGNHDIVKRNAEWTASNLSSCYVEQRRHYCGLFGGIDVREGIVLENTEEGYEILLTHGHQVDNLNYEYWRLARFLVRHLWRPLEMAGIKDPTSARNNYHKKDKIEKKLSRWADRERVMLIAGHTHRPMYPMPGESLYFNDGSCVHPLKVSAIELVKGQITLVQWRIHTREDGSLSVQKDIVEGPTRIGAFFRAMCMKEGK